MHNLRRGKRINMSKSYVVPCLFSTGRDDGETMVIYNERDLKYIDYFERMPYNKQGYKYGQFLEKIPLEHKRYKCHTCYKILDQPDLINGKCPICGEIHLEEMCPLDHNGCKHEIQERIAFCPICGKAICPECGDHNVVQISRVTGYLQDVAGWNNSKRQELKDRTRTNIGNSGEISIAPLGTIRIKA